MSHYEAMKTFLLAFILFTPSLFATDTWPSPKTGYTAFALRGKDDTGMRLILRKDATKTEKQIFESPRWFDVSWSPDGRFFCIEDHADGHTTNLHVFGLLLRSSPDTLGCDLIYATPWPQNYDMHWKLLKWDMEKGVVKIQCHFDANGTAAFKRNWVTKTYIVPIDYTAD